MKERPIIFNSEMVRAILDGRKTQTRRIVAPQPGWNERVEDLDSMGEYPGQCFAVIGNSMSEIKCHYGQPGDRLWVRETFSTSTKGWIYKADGHDLSKALSTRWKPSIHMPRWASRITLEITNVRVERLRSIDYEDIVLEGIEVCDNPDHNFIYSMPGDIGRLGCPVCGHDPEAHAVKEFSKVWQSIYGEESWNSNPWVWVVEFKNATT